MDSTRTVDTTNLLTLQQAAQRLAVSVDVLLQWNEHNILKPSITPTGEVGYRVEQIDQFLGIRQVTHPYTPQPNQIPVIKHEHNIPASNYYQKDYSNFHSTLKSPDFPRTRTKYFSIGPTSAALTLGVALVVILITQPTKIQFLIDQATSMENALASQISRLNISGSATPNSPIQLKSGIASDKNLNNVGETVLENKLTMFDAIFGKKTTKATATTGKVNTATLGANTQIGQTNSFGSSTTTANPEGSNTNSVFDNGGNIKGKTTGTNLLATSLGVNGIMQNDGTIKQVINLNTPLAILTLGLFSLVFVFKKRLPAYSTKKPANNALVIDPNNFINDNEEDKILEVDQKTDGTVVLYFQGKEYKVCKPELDSESDQFIERLMGMITPGVKEIDYDSFNDQQIRLSAPLSKLVTRLGFVGIKRDLFFPRTSKNRVLFRRYLTQNDLTSMNLTTEQISSEFLSFS
jgi:hypothetical protein